MNKLAYLDAMDVPRWRLRDTNDKPYAVMLDEDDSLAQAQPLIDSVLVLLKVSTELCEFRTTPAKGKAVVWDLRRVKSRPRVAWLVSDSLTSLMASGDAKRALWQQICDWQAAGK